MRLRHFLIILFGSVFIFPTLSSADDVELDLKLSKECKSALLMEASTGRIIGHHNMHEMLPPASMVKMMVAYVVFQHLEEGLFKLDDVVTTSAFASKIGGSQVYLKEHEQFTIEELLQAVLVQSANDASVALAEHIAGESSGFVALMNNAAQEIGMTETVFNSPHGLPPGKDQEPDLLSAFDLALLGRALMTRFPQSLKYTAISEAPFRDGKFQMRNHNSLVRTFPGCDGIKTGYYREAGYSVTATALRKDLRMIAVVLGCTRSKFRNAETSRLLSVGLATHRAVTVIKKGEVVEPIPVRRGKVKQVSPVAAADLKVVVKALDVKRIKKEFQLPSLVKAPVLPGTRLGKMTVKVEDQLLGEVDLIAPNKIERNWIGKLFGLFGK